LQLILFCIRTDTRDQDTEDDESEVEDYESEVEDDLLDDDKVVKFRMPSCAFTVECFLTKLNGCSINSVNTMLGDARHDMREHLLRAECWKNYGLSMKQCPLCGVITKQTFLHFAEQHPMLSVCGRYCKNKLILILNKY